MGVGNPAIALGAWHNALWLILPKTVMQWHTHITGSLLTVNEVLSSATEKEKKFKQNFLTTYTYEQVFHRVPGQLNKFWFHSKMFKMDVLQTLPKMLSPPNDTLVFCKFLHNNTTESSEIWQDASHWLIESYYAVFMGKTYCLELKFEFNDFTISLRGGWL